MMVCATDMKLVQTQKARMLINAGRLIYLFRYTDRENHPDWRGGPLLHRTNFDATCRALPPMKFSLPLFRHTLPQHVVAQFPAVRTQFAQCGKFVPEHLVGMRLFMFLERFPVGDDGDMAVLIPGTAQ